MAANTIPTIAPVLSLLSVASRTRKKMRVKIIIVLHYVYACSIHKLLKFVPSICQHEHACRG